MTIFAPLVCLNLGPKRVRGKNESMDEENCIFDVQAKYISKPKEEATKNIMKTEMYECKISLCI